MKQILIGAALAALASVGAHAQAVRQRYQGAFFVTDAAGCENPDGSVAANVGEHFVFVFRTDDT